MYYGENVIEVLKGCGCEEYDQLKAVIAGEKSKYRCCITEN